MADKTDKSSFDSSFEQAKDTAKKTASRWGKKAFSLAGIALNRADEIGGEVRDYLQEKIEESPRAKAATEKVMSTFRKSDLTQEKLDKVMKERGARTKKMESEVEQAPPPTRAEVEAAEARRGLGDPSLVAQIYGRNSCPWSGRAITLLENNKVDYDYLDLDDGENAEFENKLLAETKQNTVPYIYLRGEFIGGFNALNEIHRLGQLDERLKPKSQRKGNVANVEVAQRPNTDEVAPADVSHPGDSTIPPN